MKRKKYKILVRETVIEDVPEMMELIRDLAVFEKEPDSVTVSLEEFRESGFGKKPVWNAIVAEYREETTTQPLVVGMALYYVRYSTWKGKMLYLEDIIVKENFRGKGIGSLLMNRLIDTARRKKYSGVMWQVLNWNQPAISFYEKIEGTNFDDSWVNVKLMF